MMPRGTQVCLQRKPYGFVRLPSFPFGLSSPIANAWYRVPQFLAGQVIRGSTRFAVQIKEAAVVGEKRDVGEIYRQ